MKEEGDVRENEEKSRRHGGARYLSGSVWPLAAEKNKN